MYHLASKLFFAAILFNLTNLMGSTNQNAQAASMALSKYELQNIQNILSSFTNAANSREDAVPVKRAWSTKKEIVSALLNKSNSDTYFLPTPNFNLESTIINTLDSSLNANIQVSGFSAGVELSFSKVVSTTMMVQYYDPDIDYSDLQENQSVRLFKNGEIDNRVDESLSKADQEAIWKKRQMIFNCVINAEINMSERGDLSLGIEAGGSGIGASASASKDNIIRSTFYTSAIPVPMGIATSESNRNVGKLVTSFMPLRDICQQDVANAVTKILDANIKAELASRVFKSNLSTCEQDKDCLNLTPTKFTKWHLEWQKRKFYCEEKSDLPGVKVCVKRGLYGATCSNKTNSELAPCHHSMKCKVPSLAEATYSSGFSTINSAAINGLGSCVFRSYPEDY